MNYTKTIYNPTKTLIIIGDANLSKTSTINAFLQTNFCAQNETKTKITTIFKFDNTYSLILPNKSQIFNNIEDLTIAYNNIIFEDEIDDIDIIVNLNNNRIKNLIMIDTIGKSLDYPSLKLENKILKLKNLYPNNLTIELIKQPYQNCLRTCENKIYILGFADLIDYTKDKILEDIHFQYLDMIHNKKLYLNSNVHYDKTFTIKNEFVRCYGLNTTDKLFDTICNSFEDKIKVKQLEFLSEDPNIINAESIDDLKNALYYYNNDFLSNKFERIIDIKNFISANKMYKICKNAINDMKSKQNTRGIGIKKLQKILISHFKNNSRLFDSNMIELLKNNNLIGLETKMYDEVKKRSKNFTNITMTHLLTKRDEILLANVSPKPTLFVNNTNLRLFGFRNENPNLKPFVNGNQKSNPFGFRYEYPNTNSNPFGNIRNKFDNNEETNDNPNKKMRLI
jgi:hypothetical protein